MTPIPPLDARRQHPLLLMRYLPAAFGLLWITLDVPALLLTVEWNDDWWFGAVIGMAVGHFVVLSGNVALSAREDRLLFWLLMFVLPLYCLLAAFTILTEAFCAGMSVTVLLAVLHGPFFFLRQLGYSVRLVQSLEFQSAKRWQVSLKQLFTLTTLVAVGIVSAQALLVLKSSAGFGSMALLFLASFLILCWMPWVVAYYCRPSIALVLTPILGSLWGALLSQHPFDYLPLTWCLFLTLAIGLHINLLRFAGYSLVNEFDENATYCRL